MRARFIEVPRGSIVRYRRNRIDLIGLNFFVDRIHTLLVYDYEEGLFLYCGNSTREFVGLGVKYHNYTVSRYRSKIYIGRMRIRNGLAMYIDDSAIDPSVISSTKHKMINCSISFVQMQIKVI